MSAHDADHKDAAQMLLDAFEEIKGSTAHSEDEFEAERLAKLPLAPEAIISRMRAVAQRNGAGWRPSRLRYFANPITDLLQEKPQPKTTQHTQPADSVPLTEEEHEQSLTALQALETPEQRRRVELVGTLEPRATFPELLRLLHDRIDEAEFARRLQRARQRRKQTPGLSVSPGVDPRERAS